MPSITVTHYGGGTVAQVTYSQVDRRGAHLIAGALRVPLSRWENAYPNVVPHVGRGGKREVANGHRDGAPTSPQTHGRRDNSDDHAAGVGVYATCAGCHPRLRGVASNQDNRRALTRLDKPQERYRAGRTDCRRYNHLAGQRRGTILPCSCYRLLRWYLRTKPGIGK